MDAPSPSAMFLFGQFCLDRRGGGLFRSTGDGDTVPVTIGCRALEILGVLIERRGDLVSKEEIRSAVWPTTVVEDANLTVQISALRRILDPKGSDASCIQTVIGRGYRFVAPVSLFKVPLREIYAAAPDADPSAPCFIAETGTPWHRDTSSTVLAGGAGFASTVLRTQPEPTDAPAAAGPPGDWRQSVLVMPFENSSGDLAQDGIAAGIARDVTTLSIAQYPRAPFVPARIAATYLGKPFNPSATGQDPNMHFVLTGDARRQDDRLIVSATLYQTEDGLPVWSRQYDLADHPDSWALVVQSIVSNVNHATRDAEVARAMRERPDCLDTRDLLMAAGQRDWSQLSRERYQERLAYAERALELDPDHVSALSMAARVRALLVQGGYSSDPDADLARAAKEIDRALLLEPHSFAALHGKTAVLRAHGDLCAAAALLRRAIELRPAWGHLHKDLGRVLFPPGDYKEALAEFEIAKRFALGVEPAQVDDTNLAMALVANGRFREAIAPARVAIGIFSLDSGRDAEVPWLALIAAESQNGQDEDASADLKTFLASARTWRSMAAFTETPCWAASPNLLEGLRLAGMPQK